MKALLGAIAALVAVAVVVRGRRTGQILATVLGFLVGDVLRVRRDHVERAMRRAGIDDASRTARRMYRSLGRSMVEFVAMSLRPADAVIDVRVPSEVIDVIRRDGRGAVIATAHTGNWDLAACAIAMHTPLTVVTKRLSVGLLDRFWQKARRARGVTLVGVGEAARGIARAVRRGELAAMLIDQAPERGRGVSRTRFLEADAWVDLAPALTALRVRAPLVVAFPLRAPDGSHLIEVRGVFQPPCRGGRVWAIETMREATRLLEVFVREHPEQWLWMHRRWKDAPVTDGLPSRRGGHLAGVSP